ncbi:MAG: response regulator transcription factor, partial [Anaerolineales bacterium]
TGYDNELYIQEITNAGARGYLLKSDDLSLNLAQAVRKISKGERYYSSRVLDKLLMGSDKQDVLTEQELDVLRLVSQGLINERIGEVLGVSERRVRNILTSIYSKMGIQEKTGINPRVAVVIEARKMGLLPEG